MHSSSFAVFVALAIFPPPKPLGPVSLHHTAADAMRRFLSKPRCLDRLSASAPQRFRLPLGLDPRTGRTATPLKA